MSAARRLLTFGAAAAGYASMRSDDAVPKRQALDAQLSPLTNPYAQGVRFANSGLMALKIPLPPHAATEMTRLSHAVEAGTMSSTHAGLMGETKAFAHSAVQAGKAGNIPEAMAATMGTLFGAVRGPAVYAAASMTPGTPEFAHERSPLTRNDPILG